MSKEEQNSINLLDRFLKSNKDDHYNFEDEVDYKVSSGSLQFDLHLGGGFGPGLHRFCGINEGGKTSEALEVCKNFLTTVKGSKSMFIKAEGRLSPEMRKRSGVKFVTKTEDWVDGTCFVLESNIYETICEIMTQLVDNNEDGSKFCFVLDSVDGLILKNDSAKSYEDSHKVAGGANVASTFMKKMAIKLAKRGHMAIFISQVRADIKLDPYTKAPVRQTSATGGNALLHFANWIIEFEARYNKDLILKNPTIKKMDMDKNPPVGHFANVTVKKSPNEKTNSRITYPVRYGRVGGNSIWIEKEIVDLLFAWEFLSKKGSWITVTEDFNEYLKEENLTFPEKLQGENKVFNYLEENQSLCDNLVKYFKNAISEFS